MLGFVVKRKDLEWKSREGTPRSRCVNAVDKRLRPGFGVKAVDKGVRVRQAGFRLVNTKNTSTIRHHCQWKNEPKNVAGRVRKWEWITAEARREGDLGVV